MTVSGVCHRRHWHWLVGGEGMAFNVHDVGEGDRSFGVKKVLL